VNETIRQADPDRTKPRIPEIIIIQETGREEPEDREA